MIIDIFYDTTCPWCWISIQHLLTALQQWQGESIQLQWHPYLLDSTVSTDGIEFRRFMSKRKGLQPQQLNRLFQLLAQQGASTGIKLNFEKITLAVNTKLSHQLIRLTPDAKKTSVVKKIYRAFFEDGLNIDDRDTLLLIANEVGLNIDDLKIALLDKAVEKQIIKDATLARLRGIMSVPFLIINKQFKITQSQSPSVFIRSLNRASLISSLNPPYYCC